MMMGFFAPFDHAQKKVTPYSISVSPDGSMFVMTASDRKIRIFSFLNGKLQRVYDESIDFFLNQQQACFRFII